MSQSAEGIGYTCKPVQSDTVPFCRSLFQLMFNVSIDTFSPTDKQLVDFVHD